MFARVQSRTREILYKINIFLNRWSFNLKAMGTPWIYTAIYLRFTHHHYILHYQTPTTILLDHVWCMTVPTELVNEYTAWASRQWVIYTWRYEDWQDGARWNINTHFSWFILSLLSLFNMIALQNWPAENIWHVPFILSRKRAPFYLSLQRRN